MNVNNTGVLETSINDYLPCSVVKEDLFNSFTFPMIVCIHVVPNVCSFIITK